MQNWFFGVTFLIIASKSSAQPFNTHTLSKRSLIHQHAPEINLIAMANFQSVQQGKLTQHAKVQKANLFYVKTSSPAAAYRILHTRSLSNERGLGFSGLLADGFHEALVGYTNCPNDGYRARREVVAIYDGNI